jgi:signal transduction histidine kinase
MVPEVEGQAPPWMSDMQRRLTMLVLSALLVLELVVSEMQTWSLPHALAMGVLTLVLIALGLAGAAVPPLPRIGAMAAATIGLTLLTRSVSVAPVGVYIVILESTQDFSIPIAALFSGVVAAFWLVVALLNPAGGGYLNCAVNAGFFAFAFLVLYGVQRLRQEQYRSQQLLAELEASRGRELEAAKVAERTRLARDIHDVLAHSLTALVVQLDSARMLLQRERASEDALESVQRARHLAQEGLDETRRAVGTLRGDRVPGAAMLSSLVADFERDSGSCCDLSVEGQVVELPSRAQLALYRTAQEALTNVRKHARGNPVQMHLQYDPTGAELTVEDSGAPPPLPHGEDTGYGLEGMRERAELLGGSLEAGPNEHGWRVRLWLPA